MNTCAIQPSPAAYYRAAMLNRRRLGRIAGPATEASGSGDAQEPYCQTHPQDANCVSVAQLQTQGGVNDLTAPYSVTGDPTFIDPNSAIGRQISATLLQESKTRPLPYGASNVEGQAGPFINVGPMPILSLTTKAGAIPGTTPTGTSSGFFPQFSAQFATLPNWGWAVLLGAGVLAWMVFTD